MSKTFRDKSFLVRWLCFCALGLGATSALTAQSGGNAPAARLLVPRPVDSSRLYTLAGNTRSAANAQNDRGKVADTFAMEHMLLHLQRSPVSTRRWCTAPVASKACAGSLPCTR